MAKMSDSMRNELHHIILEAIGAGVSVEEFRQEAAYTWQVALDEEKQSASKAWK